MRFYTYANGFHFFDLRNAVLEQIKSDAVATRKSGKEPRQHIRKYMAAFDCLIANLAEAYLQELPLAIGRRDSHFKRRHKPNPENLTAYIMRTVVDQLSQPNKKERNKLKKNKEGKFDGLKNIGILEIKQKGYYDRGGSGNSEVTLYQPTERFGTFLRMPMKPNRDGAGRELFIERRVLNEPLVKIECYSQDEDDKRTYFQVDFTRADVIQTAATLSELETLMDEHKFTFKSVSFRPPLFVRKFSKDYQGHGRIYCDGGSFQNWKNKFIRQLLIDGQAVTELDFSSTHIAIAYAERDLPLVQAYALTTLSPIQDGDLRRQLGKCFVNIMLNAKTAKSAQQAIGKAFADEGIKYGPQGLKISIPELVDEIRQKHAPIKDIFYSNAGLRLQKIESDICLLILDQFAQLNKPIIPKHDSFIVKREDQDLLRTTMEEAWIHVISQLKASNDPVHPPRISTKY